MRWLPNRETRVLVQGITGREGAYHTEQMLAYGTNIVAGVTPGKGGEWLFARIPIFDSVQEACHATGATVSVMFVPPRAAVDALYEAISAQLELIVCITENIPVRDMMHVKRLLALSQTVLLGPSSPGLIVPNQVKLGIIPSEIAIAGRVGIVSRSSTLLYEVTEALTRHEIGQRACIGLGGDMVSGTHFTDVLTFFEDDPYTDCVVLIGEIGGVSEQRAARFIRERMTKPVIAYIAGKTAPKNQRMGHAGAIVEGEIGSYEEKVEALLQAGVRLAETPDAITRLLAQRL
ncbi:MAG: succinate--CoA ligase subunit alpha [Candidatus Thermofonsia Clade 1 bacterium]|uniref:Succinate--CoA ligase [ADP-forming] subunit alpha n=1 Tax=Candidatus Thermofonsia Clade 1 bacterium TaxID=2364210 RepID=A0A2M8PFG0_9CHLR|nr:MAG: succinate--CoA ligase subunit alpha [Candidatus Thermofonsia Clade 1 bacterium]RMF49456.1 MAG: succinate--CoA ligase subunit alpha [Chloroflexota bacterium]